MKSSIPYPDFGLRISVRGFRELFTVPTSCLSEIRMGIRLPEVGKTRKVGDEGQAP